MELRLATLLVIAFVGLVSAGPRRIPSLQSGADHATENELIDLLKEICPEVNEEVTAKVPAKFAELVHSLKSVSRATIARIHKKVHDRTFCASGKLADIWSDALIMDASEGSLKLVAEQIIRQEVSASRANYLFTMMAFSRQPTAGAVRAVIPILEAKEVPRQALLGISALIRNSWSGGQPQQTPEIRDAVKAIVKYLDRNMKHQDRVIVALKALQNIGAIDEAQDQVIRLASDASHTSGVRVAAIEALRGLAAQQQVRAKAMAIFQNTQESSEIRIAAYKLAVESQDQAIVSKIVQVIRREENKQVGAFVCTHLKNLRDSSSPRHEAVRRILQDEKIPAERFPQDLRKYSRNFEVSQYVEKLGFGGVFDADLIYDKSFAPRSMKLNLTVPVYGSEYNLLEFGFRQVGLEEEITKLVGPHLKGTNVPEILTEIVSEMVDLFDQQPSNEIQSGRFKRMQQRQNIFQKLSTKSDLEAAVYLNFDGKTIAYLDIADLAKPENDMTRVIRSLIHEIKNSDNVDRAYSFMFMKNEYEIPAKDGMQSVAVNGTVVFGLKGDRNGFWPSFAFEMSTRTPNTRYVQRLSSSPALRFGVEYKNNRPVKVAFSLPQEANNLFSLRSETFDIDAQGTETLSSATKKITKCTSSLTRPFGIEFCTKMTSPKEMFGKGVPPFNGLWDVQLEVMKTDRQMSGWELALELPQSGDDDYTYRLAFDTPSSRVSRRMAIQVRSFNQFRGLQVKLESPANSLDAAASYELSATEVGVKAELTTGSQEKYSFEMGVMSDHKGKKQEWTPVLRISAPHMQPIALTGSVAISRGRKSQFTFELRSETDKRFVKGAFVRDGAVSLFRDFRLSSDVHADFGLLSFRVFSMAERQANSLSCDLKVDYQTPNSRKHTVKVVGKLHDLSTAAYAKMNSFVDVQTSQYPSNNFHVSWNFLVKPEEHVENELTVMWADQMRDQNKKIHILQVSKASGLRNGLTARVDNILSVEIAPIDFKYEIKASGNTERSETPKYKVQLELNNKNKKDEDVQATFEVNHVSVEPFKMSIDAALLTAARELRYSDKVEQVSPHVFKGRTQIQWHQDKKTTIGYTLKVKSDSKKTDLEVDAEIKTPSMRHGLRHQGLLRASWNAIEVQSKLNYEKSNIWDIESNLRRQGKSNMRVTMKGFEGKAEAHLSSSPKNMMIELKGNDFSHFSNLLIANDALTLSSKSMVDQKPVVVINVRKNAKDDTRVNIECTMFDARVELSDRNESPMAVFEYRGKTGDKLALKTQASFSQSEGIELSGESKSESSAPHSASLKVKRTAQGVSVAVHSEQNNKEWIVGKALLEEINTGLRATAQISNWGSQIGRFQSELNQQILAGPHDLEINFQPEAPAKQQTLKIHHEVGAGEAKSVFTYFVDGQQKGQLENFAHFKSSDSELDVAAGISLKSEIKYHSLDGLYLSFQHRHKNERKNFHSETRFKGQVSEEQKYEFALTSARSGDRKAGKADIKATLETPIYDFKRQSSQLTAQWSDEKISLEHRTTAKYVNMFLNMNIARSLVSGPHDVKVEYTVSRAAPWSFEARHEIVNGNVRSDAEYLINGKKQASARVSGQLKRKSGQIDLAGPHDLEIQFETASTEPQSLKWHHEVKDGEVRCLLTHYIQGQQKQQLENQARFKCSGARDCKVSATVTFKSQLYKDFDGLSASVEHKHKIDRKNIQAETKVWGRNYEDKKYQMVLTSSATGDRNMGEVILKAAFETPLAKYERQTSELNARWTDEKFILEHKTQSTDVNVALNTIINRNLINGPHEIKLVCAVPRIEPFTAEMNHQIVDGNLKTSADVRVSGKQELAFSATGRMQRTDSRLEASLDAVINDKRFRHSCELLTKSDEIALDSKSFWQEQPIAIVKSRFHLTEASFIDIDCPVFKMRENISFPGVGSLNFANKIRRREAVKSRFTIDSRKAIVS